VRRHCRGHQHQRPDHLPPSPQGRGPRGHRGCFHPLGPGPRRGRLAAPRMPGDTSG
jgi:hypothetical protein